MSDSDRRLAKEIKTEHDILTDVSIATIEEQVRSLRATGVADQRIHVLIPKLFRIKETVDQEAEDQTSLSPREIRIESLPDEFDREDWS